MSTIETNFQKFITIERFSIIRFFQSTLLIILLFIGYTVSDSLPVCKEGDFKYDFTECDAFGGKWRVMVPNSLGHCTGGLSYVPTRVHNCYTSCEGGQFFNKSTLFCEDCLPGHYSLSGGIVFDNFNNFHDQFPEGFHIKTESKDHNFGSNTKCPEWYVDNITGSLVSQIEMKPDNIESDCVSVITYTAKVVKRGRLRFTYHYKTPNNMPLSLLFTFNYRLYDGIGIIEDDINTNIKFPMTTVERNFETIDLQLQTPGLYIFTWKSILIKNFRDYFSVSNMINFDNYGRNPVNFDAKDSSKDNQFYRENLFQTKRSNIGMIRIEKIIIEGIAYASECTPCEAGTYAPEPGMKECLLCPRNTAFNGSGAINCLKCDPFTEYAVSGSTHCSKRPVCGNNDFYSISKEPCNPNTFKQEIEYRWIEPRICVDINNVFPKENTIINCTMSNNTIDCDLGMELKSDSVGEFCQLCPEGYYRDEGMKQCEPCPPVTNPFYALWIRHWNNSLPGWSGPISLPNSLFFQEDYFAENSAYLNSYFNRQCFLSDDLIYADKREDSIFDLKDECIASVAWQPFQDYIRTGASAPLDAYLVFSLTIPSFRSTNETEISFHFELNCEIGDQCLFLFVETRPDESDLRLQDLYEKDFNQQQKQSNNKKKYFSFSQQTINQVIKKWTQPTVGKTVFNHKIERNTSLTFSWIFKRSTSFQSYTKIHSLLLTGSIVGSAIRCQSCPILSKSMTQCISCPHGQYLQIKDNDNKIGQNLSELNESSSTNFQCQNCPKNHVLNTSIALPLGIESCVPCGENMISDNETNICYSDCLISFDQDHYDLNELHKPILYKGINLFTSGGTQYMNLFKISLCGHRKRDDLSTCLNNITVFSDDSSGVRSFICRSTIIPDGSKVFAAQSASLGDELLLITRESSYENLSVHEDFLYSPDANKYGKDFYLFFKTKTPTSACPSGRKLTITMRCMFDRDTTVKTPNSCPDGTCNGCDFHLLIETGTAAACRLCRPYSDDYEIVVGECIDGSQQVHYLNPKGCVVKKSLNVSNIKYVLNRSCSLLLPKQVQIGIALAMVLGLLLLLLVFYFWNKNRSLEYKYTKLIENTSEGKGNDELTIDNCCVEDEDDINGGGENSNYSQLSFNNKNNNDKSNENIPHYGNNHNLLNKKLNNRIDKKNDIKLVESQVEMQQLFPDANKSHTIDDEGYETIHLISVNNNTNIQNPTI